MVFGFEKMNLKSIAAFQMSKTISRKEKFKYGYLYFVPANDGCKNGLLSYYETCSSSNDVNSTTPNRGRYLY